MFIKRNRARLAGKTYESILLIQGKRVPAKRPPGRPRADSAPPKSVVVHETLANLSRLPAKLIELIEAFCKDPQAKLGPVPMGCGSRAQSSSGEEELEMGPCYGVLAGRRERLAKVSWTTTDLGGALSARGRPGGRLAGTRLPWSSRMDW